MNGTFLKWVGSVVAGLVLLAVSGGVLFDRDMAKQLAIQGGSIIAIQTQIENYRADQRQAGAFNRTDAEREFHYRDQAIERLEHRIEELEKRSNSK